MCDVVCCGKGEMAMYGLVAAGSHAVHAMVRLRCKRFRFFPTSFPVRAPSTVATDTTRETTTTPTHKRRKRAYALRGRDARVPLVLYKS